MACLETPSGGGATTRSAPGQRCRAARGEGSLSPLYQSGPRLNRSARYSGPEDSEKCRCGESFETYRPSFDELFDRFWSNFGGISRPKSEHLESLTVETVVSVEAARWGGRVRLWIPARATCSACGGYGVIGGFECWRCEGNGALTAEYPVEVSYPPGILDGYAVRIPLSRYGIENFYLTVVFRVDDL